MADVTTKVDDITGEDEDVRTVYFSYEGEDYRIDLTRANQRTLEERLDEFIASAERLEPKTTPPSGRNRRKRGQTKTGRKNTRSGTEVREIREWAQSRGYDIADYGRIPTWVYGAYEARKGQATSSDQESSGQNGPTESMDGREDSRYVPAGSVVDSGH